MDLVSAGFDWDRGNLEKCRRHGVEIADIEELFRRILWVTPDPSNSTRQRRFRAIGTNARGRHIFVAFTLRSITDGMLIRPISARYMHRREIRHYEKQKIEAEKISAAEDK
jgi:uncharacterized DUF497 family protein